jgi:hypothetical protein
VDRNGPSIAQYGAVDPTEIAAGAGLAAAFVSGLLAGSKGGWRQSAILTPLFVVEFAALLLLGPDGAIAIVLAGAAGQAVMNSSRSMRRALMDTGATLLAIQAAGGAYRIVGATADLTEWPWQAILVAAAILAYCIARGIVIEILSGPNGLRRPLRTTSSARALRPRSLS